MRMELLWSSGPILSDPSVHSLPLPACVHVTGLYPSQTSLLAAGFWEMML